MNKEDTIAIIRSLLTSTQSTLDLYALNRDFKNETGSNIPLFGYENLGEFLRSLPENFVVIGEYPNQVIKPVINDKSSHIVSLVQRQKSTNTKSNNKKKTLCYRKYYPSHLDNSSGNDNDEGGNNKPTFNTSKSVEDNLISYLMTCPDGATFEDIQKNIEAFEAWESTIRLHHIIAFIKKFSDCVFYEGRFYAVESFKTKMKNNETSPSEM